LTRACDDAVLDASYGLGWQVTAYHGRRMLWET